MREEPVADGSDKRMRLRYAGVCRLCGTALPAREEAIYERSTKKVRCVECPPDFPGVPGATPEAAVIADDHAPVEVVDHGGVAGASARREYQRRKANDEERLRQKWGRFGSIAVALSDEKQSTKAWATGAIGEERLGARLDSLISDSIAVLHDRRIPGTKANIDHIAITSAGVWVIDAKRYKGRPALKVEGGIRRPRVEKVFVGRRDCTKLVDGVLKQIDLVRQVVGNVPVTGALCFVEADWPLIGGAFTTRGVHALWPKRLAKMLVEAGGPVNVPATRDALASHFSSA
jgi:hypothetical protein